MRHGLYDSGVENSGARLSDGKEQESNSGAPRLTPAAANPARIIPKDRRTIDLLRLEMLLRLA